MPSKNELNVLLNRCGGVAELAGKLNLSRAAVYKWIERGTIPALRAVEIEKLSGGAVGREQLRPDIFGA